MKPSSKGNNIEDVSEKNTSQLQDDNSQNESASSRKLSRVERLKRKVRKMQGKNPDIYPMW